MAGIRDNKNLIDAYSKISAIDFNYTPEAQQMYQGENGVDGDEHVGVKAQDLQNNEGTPNVVKEDENGNLGVDTKELTMSNTATISELCRLVKLICEKLGIEE